MKINKLNKKGFTLIELLAVVVILAIVMGISGSSVINSMNRARRSSLLSAAQSAANKINEWVAEDELTYTDSERILGNAFVSYIASDSAKEKWKCLSSLSNEGAGKNSNISASDLYNKLGLSENDFNFTGEAPSGTTAPTTTNCSSIRFSEKSGSYEILLVAKSGGKYYVNADGSSKNFAFNKAVAYATALNY